jgi:hypothetical protein
MTERLSSHARPGDRSRGGYAAGEPYDAAGTGGPAADSEFDVRPAGVRHSARRQAADSRGFLGALFDLSFASFATTRIIRALYVLILILTGLAALIYTILAFSASPVFGFLALVIGDPLFIVVVMAFWRLVLESFVVVFRIAEDVHALRSLAGRWADRGQQR